MAIKLKDIYNYFSEAETQEQETVPEAEAEMEPEEELPIEDFSLGEKNFDELEGKLGKTEGDDVMEGLSSIYKALLVTENKINRLQRVLEKKKGYKSLKELVNSVSEDELSMYSQLKDLENSIYSHREAIMSMAMDAKNGGKSKEKVEDSK